MIGCLSCGAIWTQQEKIAVQSMMLRSLGAQIGEHTMYGEKRSGPSLAATVMKMLDQPAFAMAILDAVT